MSITSTRLTLDINFGVHKEVLFGLLFESVNKKVSNYAQSLYQVQLAVKASDQQLQYTTEYKIY